MNFNKIKASNSTLVYIIIAMAIIVIILILGGADWLRGSQLSQSFRYSHWNWPQILVSIGIGFTIGWAMFKKGR